jgi:TP901-1 family phage major tail protein
VKKMPEILLPQNPSTNLALAGRSFLLYVNTGTLESPDWLKIGGQRDTTRNLEGTEIDTSNKSDNGWASAVVGILSWGLDLEAIVTGDALGGLSQTMQVLNQAFRNRQQLNVKFEFPDKSYETGWVYIVSQPLSTPHDDVATISATLKGVGDLSALITDETEGDEGD